MTGVFPSVLKTARLVPVFKKDSKLNYRNYRPVSLLSNIEKILSMTYSLDSDNTILHLMP